MIVEQDALPNSVARVREEIGEDAVSIGEENRSGAGLLSRARFVDVVLGKAPLVGARINPDAQRGWVSPVEARVQLGIPYGDLLAEEEKLLKALSLRQKVPMVLRAFVAWLLSPRGGSRVPRRPLIVSAHVDNITIDEALAATVASPPAGRARIIYIVHPHALNIAKFDNDYAQLLTRADLVLPDGIGIRIAASILGVGIRHNLNGTDLLPLICKAAVRSNLPLVLIGGSDGIAEECALRLQRDTPGLSIAMTHQGYLTETDSAAVAKRIHQLGRCIVLVGMGTPIQERWALDRLASARNATVITVGGLFDFFSGRIPRAPVAWRELGMEWLWRLRMEPRRLTKRYLIGNPLFLVLACMQRIKETIK